MYVDGDLAPPVAREMERHLWTCARCRELFLDFRSLVAIVRLVAPRATGSATHGLRDPFGRGPSRWIVS